LVRLEADGLRRAEAARDVPPVARGARRILLRAQRTGQGQQQKGSDERRRSAQTRGGEQSRHEEPPAGADVSGSGKVGATQVRAKAGPIIAPSFRSAAPRSILPAHGEPTSRRRHARAQVLRGTGTSIRPEDRGRPLRRLSEDRGRAPGERPRPAGTRGHRRPVVATDVAGYTRRIREAAARHAADRADQRGARFGARHRTGLPRRSFRAPGGAALRAILEHRPCAQAAGRIRRGRLEGARRLSHFSTTEVLVARLTTAMLLLALVLPVVVSAQTATTPVPPARDPRISAIADAPQPDRIERDIRTLVDFGTRSTLSDTLSTTRGIGAARRWIKAEFDRIFTACGGCLEVRYQRMLVKGRSEERRVGKACGHR